MSYIETDLSLLETDLVLDSWARVRGLFVSKEFTEKSDRFIQVLDDAGDSYGLWVSPPRDNGSVSIVLAENAVNGLRVPDYKARTQTFATKFAGLGKTLNAAYALAESWMRERGHMRARAFALSL